jgi:3-phosphoshikimate 1-carboxyvinyltransferase
MQLRKDYIEKLITPSGINGKINAPTSKNLTQRAIIAASLAKGRTEISNSNLSEDVQSFLDVFKKLNVNFEINRNQILIDNSKMIITDNLFNCGESAFCVRTMTTILSIYKAQKKITGMGTLLKRDFADILQLNKYGVKIELNNNKLPIIINNSFLSKYIEIDGSQSSQLISGLLFALPKMSDDSILKVINPVSIPYLEMTMNTIAKFGIDIDITKNENSILYKIKGNQDYHPTNLTLENDWSNTAILLVIGAIAGDIKIQNIDINSIQGDKAIIDILKSANADICFKNNKISIKRSNLKSFIFNAKNNPDLVPALMILALKCEGISVIEGISRLKNKESDRVNILAGELTKFGAKIIIQSDKVEIEKSEISGGEADSHSDHRIAMALAAAGLISRKGIKIKNAHSVNKSFPEFWEIF